jgi:hypothetical protein
LGQLTAPAARTRAADLPGSAQVGRWQSLSLTPEETSMLDFIKTFRADEDGVVTVDWVVLTAAMVGLAIAVAVVIRSGSAGMSNNLSNELTSTAVSNIGPWMNNLIR